MCVCVCVCVCEAITRRKQETNRLRGEAVPSRMRVLNVRLRLVMRLELVGKFTNTRPGKVLSFFGLCAPLAPGPGFSSGSSGALGKPFPPGNHCQSKRRLSVQSDVQRGPHFRRACGGARIDHVRQGLKFPLTLFTLAGLGISPLTWDVQWKLNILIKRYLHLQGVIHGFLRHGMPRNSCEKVYQPLH